MKITICGSMAHVAMMQEAAETLRQHGHSVVVPEPIVANGREITVDDKRRAIDRHFAAIDASDAVLVVNQPKHGIDGYIGSNTLMEIAHAYANKIPIYLLYPADQNNCWGEIEAMRPTVLNGDIDAIADNETDVPSDDGAVPAAARSILRDNPIATLATHSIEAGALATPLHIVYDDEAIYWLSSDTAEHSRNLANGPVAMTVYSPNTRQGLEGVYVRGRAATYDDVEYVHKLFGERFGAVPPALRQGVAYRLPIGHCSREKSFGNCWYFYS